MARTQHRERVAQLEREHQDAAERRIEDLAAEHRATLERTLREHDVHVHRTVADAEQRVMSSLQAADLAAGTRLAEAFRKIDAAGSLSDILNALADAVSHEAARSAIFLAGHGAVKSWKAHGFSVNGGGAIEVPAADAGIIQAALDTREAASTAGDGGDDAGVRAPVFAGLGDDRPAIAMPMIVNGEVVAVVYADQGPSGDIERASWPSIVEILAPCVSFPRVDHRSSSAQAARIGCDAAEDGGEASGSLCRRHQWAVRLQPRWYGAIPSRLLHGRGLYSSVAVIGDEPSANAQLVARTLGFPRFAPRATPKCRPGSVNAI